MRDFLNIHTLIVLPLIFFTACQEVPKGTDEVSSTTKQPSNGSIKADDGNIYATIQIGEQTWMAENLNKTTFNCEGGVEVKPSNGLERGPNVKFYDGHPRYAYYNNDRETNFGALYNYSTVRQCNLCPKGFVLPTQSDWEQLFEALGGKNKAGKRLLKQGDSGFKAQLGGRIDSYGSVLAGNFSFWWTKDTISNNAMDKAVAININRQGVIKIIAEDTRLGCYIRCVKK